MNVYTRYWIYYINLVFNYNIISTLEETYYLTRLLGEAIALKSEV